jgi:hypothetical protein
MSTIGRLRPRTEDGTPTLERELTVDPSTDTLYINGTPFSPGGGTAGTTTFENEYTIFDGDELQTVLEEVSDYLGDINTALEAILGT